MGEIHTIKYLRERNRLLRNVLEDVIDYWSAFGRATPFQALSRRYSKRSRGLGLTFRRALEVLEERKLVHIQVHESLARSVWPYKQWEEDGMSV